MRAPRRTNEAINIIHKWHKDLEYLYARDEVGSKRLSQEKEKLISNIEYLAIEKKRYRTRLYHKFKGQGVLTKPECWWYRFKIAVKYLFKGEV